MNVVVTGGAGQLGTLVLQRLIANPVVASIVSIDKRRPVVTDPKLEVVLADIRGGGLERLLRGMDALVHLAFIVATPTPRAVMDEVNVEGSKRLFLAAASAKVKAIVYSSSIAAYGIVLDHPVPIREDAPRHHQPDFAYASNKYQVEEFLDGFESNHPAIAVARLRPAILIGDTMDNPLGKLLDSGWLLHIGGDAWPIVWDEDVADAVLLALWRRARGAFNLCAEEVLQVDAFGRAGRVRTVRLPRKLVDALLALAERWAVLRGRPRHDSAWVKYAGIAMHISSERAHRELGWRPRFATATAVMQRYAARPRFRQLKRAK